MSPAEFLHWNYGTASVIEMAWTAIGIVGFLFTAQLAGECAADLASVRRAPTYLPGGAKEILARQNFRGMIQKLSLFGVFIAVGIILCLTPPGSAHPTLGSLSVGFGFLYAELALAVGSYQDRRDRIAFLRVLRVRRVDITWTNGGQPP